MAKKKESIAIKAYFKEASNKKANPELISLLKQKAESYKATLKTEMTKATKVKKAYKAVQVAYFIQIGKLKPPRISTPAAKKRAQKKKLQEYLISKYLDEKEIIDKQQQVYDEAKFANKEAIKLEFRDKIVKTQKIMDKAKAKLDSLTLVFEPVKKVKETYEA